MRPRALANLIVLVVFAAGCVAGLGVLAGGMGMPLPVVGQHGWTLRASFARAEGVVPQDDVDVSGVQVGKVVRVVQDGNGAVVTMQIDGDVHLRNDVKAYVRPKSLIGEKYVELIRMPRSTAPTVGDGFRIDRGRTGQAIEIDDIMNMLDPSTRAALSSSLRELGVAVDGRDQDINQSIPAVEQTAANLRPIAQIEDLRQQQLNRILIDLATIIQTLAEEQDALGRVVDSGDTAISAVARRDQDLAGTVQQADKLVISLDQVLSDLTPADRASLQKAPGTVQSGRELLAQLNPIIDEILPELLLAQVNYPNNQLNVSNADAITLAQEWMSAFSQTDSNGHSFRITPVIDTQTAVQPGVQLPVNLSPGPSRPPASPTPAGAMSQVPTRDASGGLIPAVVQALLGMPS